MDFKYKPAGCPQESCEDEGMDPETVVSNPQEGYSGNDGFPQRFENGFSENTHNNINNRERKIENEEEKDNGFRCEDTRSSAATAAASQASSQPLREVLFYDYNREKANDAIRQYKKWEENTYGMMMCIFDDYDVDKEALAAMKKSDEYKAFLAECEEKRQALYKEFGNTIYISPLEEM